MTLRAKTLVLISATLAGLMGMLYVISRGILLDSFAKLEEQRAHESLQRALDTLSEDIAQLDRMAGDWAPWDDTYAFIQDANEDYIQSNLVDDTFVNARLNLIAFVDRDGRIVYSKAYDFESKQETAVPQGLPDYMTDARSGALLLRHADTHSSLSGIVLLPGEQDPLLIASRPILKSGAIGPIRGTLIMGRYLGSAEIAQLSWLTRLSLAVSRWGDVQVGLSDKSPLLVRPQSEDIITGYAMLKDIYGSPVLVLKTDAPRDIYLQGQASLRYLLWSLLITGLVFIVMTLLLWDQLALSRLARLSAEVTHIGDSGDLAARVAATGRDELSTVASAVNRMLDALQKSEGALRESEDRYRRRAAEMAMLYATSLKLNAQIETSELLRVIVEQAIGLLEAEAGGLYLYDPQRHTLTLSLAMGHLKDVASVSLGPGEGLVGQAFDGRRSVVAHDCGAWPGRLDLPGADRLGELLAVPLMGTEHVLGILEIAGVAYPLDDHAVQLAELFAAQAAEALEKARLHAQEQQHARELAALNKAGQAILSVLDVQAVLELVIAEVRSLLEAEGASVLLHDPVTDELVFAAVDSPRSEQLVGRRIPSTMGIAGQVMRDQQSKLICDAYSDPRFYGEIDRLTRMTTRSLIVVPLLSKGSMMGVIEAVNKASGVFGQHDLDLLEAMAVSAAIAAENARLYQMEKEQRELAETLREVVSTLVSTLDTDVVLDRLLEQVSRVVPNDVADIMLVEGDHVRAARWRGYDRYDGAVAFITEVTFCIADTPNLRQMAETGEPVVIPDTRANPPWIRFPQLDQLCSYAGAPIRVRDKVIGFLNVNSTTLNFFGPQHAARLRVFADQAAVALENARLFEAERQVSERLQALSRRLVQVQEAERSRIARELHDEMGQALTALMVSLRLLEKDASHPEAVCARVAELKQMTGEVLDSLHRLAIDLRPASLDHVGLVVALRQYVEEFGRQHGLTAQFEAVRLEDGRLPAEMETALYRIVQEALTNVARHARASRADVVVGRRSGQVTAMIWDNGVGFDPEAAAGSGRFGLLGLRERAEMLGGQLVIDSKIGHGTTILVEIPYAH